jgi:hypothetical protein
VTGLNAGGRLANAGNVIPPMNPEGLDGGIPGEARRLKSKHGGVS